MSLPTLLNNLNKHHVSLILASINRANTINLITDSEAVAIKNYVKNGVVDSHSIDKIKLCINSEIQNLQININALHDIGTTSRNRNLLKKYYETRMIELKEINTLLSY